ncbi:MAG: beta-ketoacyl synthase N-terminal-like domain-containing protein [Planctomycetota bacterium]
MTVVISGIGIVAPCDLWALTRGPVAPRTAWPEITLIDVPEGAPEVACECADFNLASEVPTKYPFIDRCSALAIGAAARALKDAGFGIERTRTETIGLCFGTTWGCLDAMRTFHEKIKEGKPQFSSPLPFSHAFANSPSSLLAIEFGLHGFSTTYSEGHNAGLAALESALGAIEAGTADRVLVVASDAISHGTFHHYFATGRLRLGGADAPNAATGGGFVLGEGAVAILLETPAALAARGRSARGELVGVVNGGSFAASAAALDLTKCSTLFQNAPETAALDAAEADWAGTLAAADRRALKTTAGHAMAASALMAVALAARSAGRRSLVCAADERTGVTLVEVQGGAA